MKKHKMKKHKMNFSIVVGPSWRSSHEHFRLGVMEFEEKRKITWWSRLWRKLRGK